MALDAGSQNNRPRRRLAPALQQPLPRRCLLIWLEAYLPSRKSPTSHRAPAAIARLEQRHRQSFMMLWEISRRYQEGAVTSLFADAHADDSSYGQSQHARCHYESLRKIIISGEVLMKRRWHHFAIK